MAKLKILGHRLSTPEPYSAGHCCTLAEAATLNAALTRGLAKGIYRELSEDAAADIESYIASFARGFAEGHERLKAIETAAKQIARGRLEAALYRHGKKLSDLAAGELEVLLAREAESEEVQQEARRRIDTLRAIGVEGGAFDELEKKCL